MENKNVTINTGNILSLDDLTKKPGLNTTEELLEAIRLTLKDFENGGDKEKLEENVGLIARKHDDTQIKLAEFGQNDLRIGLKVFVSREDPAHVLESIEKAFKTLKITAVHNVIVAYTGKQETDGQQCGAKWKSIWSTLEEMVLSGKVLQIGVADVEEAVFRTIYEWAKIKPSIVQINLATCCVVPPTLQAFCKEHDVQLLTHSDPVDVLPDNAIQEIFSRPLSLKWALRYLVHVKCRGVLTTRGYLVCLSECNS